MNDKQVFQLLNGVEYSMWDYKKHKKLTWRDKEFEDDIYTYYNCCILKPWDVIKYRCGTCWDTAVCLKYYLEENGYQAQMCWMDNVNKINNEYTATHTFVIYKDKVTEIWSWMEYSWWQHRGIHKGLLGKDKLIRRVQDIWKKDTHDKRITFFNPDVPIENLLKLKVITQKDFILNAGGSGLEEFLE